MKLSHDDVERILKLLETSAFDALDLEIDGVETCPSSDVERLSGEEAIGGALGRGEA